MLKLSKCKTKLKRRIPFSKSSVPIDEMDKCTIYVENFPNQLIHAELAKIFSRAGKICGIRLPKFKADRVSKGFCFIEYATPEEANTAVSTFNSCVPVEFTDSTCKNFIPNIGKKTQLRVLSKADWLL